ncbi:hypothetical protein BDV33DRAFT_203805 [Aspergillus novoparasiticus]|uniref:Uncharacterized protein n=1 Tax=Aspergillus novoparasiticus TaxID=986946 RepID=A0A5N6ESR6_9EURO|nr:hypothetical protein BDV33DRAFT_203805 [Aspergillus novoparasiticus]
MTSDEISRLLSTSRSANRAYTQLSKMDTRELAEDISSHLDGFDIPNLSWGETAHIYHLGHGPFSPSRRVGVVEIVVSEYKIKCSGNYGRSSSGDTLCVNREESTARVLALARHTKSLILRLCLNIETQFAPALFDAIEEMITYYDENADNTDIWNQLLCDLNAKNDGYGEYLRRQMSDRKHAVIGEMPT